MRKEAARMIRPALRPLLIGTILAVALLGSTVRADATRPGHRMLVSGQHMLAARSAARAATDATLPAGFQESTVFDGLTFPTNFRFSPDGRVFVAEKSGHHQGLRQPRRHDADGLRRPERAGRRLLGPRPPRARARPELPGDAIHLCPLHLRRTAGGTAPPVSRGPTPVQRPPGRRPTAVSSGGASRG